MLPSVNLRSCFSYPCETKTNTPCGSRRIYEAGNYNDWYTEDICIFVMSPIHDFSSVIRESLCDLSERCPISGILQAPFPPKTEPSYCQVLVLPTNKRSSEKTLLLLVLSSGLQVLVATKYSLQLQGLGLSRNHLRTRAYRLVKATLRVGPWCEGFENPQKKYHPWLCNLVTINPWLPKWTLIP